MAKVGFWLKGAQGKLAGATIYKDDQGNTVMRQVVSPTNPKTLAQLIQRIVMHTVMQAYSKMKEIADHSFEGQRAGRDCMGIFMRENVQFARQQIAEMQAQGVDFYEMYNFTPLGKKGFTPNQYLIAMGSLPRIDVSVLEDDESLRMFYVEPIKTNTYQGVIDAYGLKRGDQLTFCMINSADIGQFGQNEFHFARVILDPTNADFTSAPLSTPFIVDGSINLPSVRNEGNFVFGVDAEKGLWFRPALNPSNARVAAAVIVSRKIGDDWARSTSYLSYIGNLGHCYSLGDCLDAAASGVASEIYTSNQRYLNNAGQGGGAAEVAGADSDAGQGGQGGGSSESGNTFVVDAVTFDGSAATVGTPRTHSVDSVPASITTRVTFSPTGNATHVRVKKSGTQIGSDHAISSGTAAFAIDAQTEGTYQLYAVVEGGTEVSLGYSVNVVVQDDGGDPN